MPLTLSTFPHDIETNPARAVLLASAAKCIRHAIPEWWSSYAVPYEELHEVVQAFASDEDVANECPETAAMFLLLVRETLH